MSQSDILTVFIAGAFLLLFFWSSVSWGQGSTRNILDQQRSNRRWSYFLIGVFAVAVGFLGLGADLFLFRMPLPQLGLNIPDPSRLPPFGTKAYWDAIEAAKSPGFPFATAIAVMGSLLMSYFNFRNAPAMVLAATRARKPDPSNPKEAQLLNVAQEMATAAGMPMPQVYVVPDPDLNAFATGTSPENAHVAVTEGLLQELNREELQGVIAHELSHIRNADMEIMTLVVALAGAAALLSDWSRRGMRPGASSSSSVSGRGKGGGYLAIVWLVFVVLAPLLSRLMAMAVSRRREYLADASGAEMTRNPVSLANALEKIRASAGPTLAMSHQGFAHLCIEDPKGSALNNSESFFGDIFSTHPPTAKRIQALREMAYLQGPKAA